MARGKVTLKETVEDSEIVRKGEVRNEPNYPLKDNEYGIAGQYKDYSLVKKTIAHRTGTIEDGEECGKVIEYINWKEFPCFHDTMVEMFNAYARILNLTEFKKKKMKGEISELIEIERRTQKIINEALSGFDSNLNKEQEEVCNLIDKKNQLQKEIDDLKNDLSAFTKIRDEVNQMYKEIKEKKVIIVDKDKPKKHRMPKEKE